MDSIKPNKMIYCFGRILSNVSWRNYLIPNRYWRLVLGKNFGGTYYGIPIFKSENLLSDSIDCKGGEK